MTVEQKPAVVGTQPAGTHDEKAAAAAVRDMFTSIAPRYDLLNHVLSFNVDRVWWRRAARTFADVLAHPQARILDLCCGTCDMALALRRVQALDRQAGDDSTPTLGAHPSPMLRSARIEARLRTERA